MSCSHPKQQPEAYVCLQLRSPRARPRARPQRVTVIPSPATIASFAFSVVSLPCVFCSRRLEPSFSTVPKGQGSEVRATLKFTRPRVCGGRRAIILDKDEEIPVTKDTSHPFDRDGILATGRGGAGSLGSSLAGLACRECVTCDRALVCDFAFHFLSEPRRKRARCVFGRVRRPLEREPALGLVFRLQRRLLLNWYFGLDLKLEISTLIGTPFYLHYRQCHH